MEKTPYYKAFVAQTPEDILQSIFKKEEAVLIGISLNNGAYVEGIIIDISKENNYQKVVCILSQDEEVSFFYTHRVTLITIKQPNKMVVELSKGTISRPIITNNKDLTSLQLKRWLNTEKNELGKHIKALNIDAVPLDQLNNRLNLQDVVKALKIAINQITKDELGQKVWQAVNTIVLQQADTLHLQIKAKTLTISIAINKALPKKLPNILEEKLLQIL